MKNLKQVLFLASVFVVCSCSVKKFIPDGKLLYTGGKVEINTATKIKEVDQVDKLLEEVLRPKPNGRFLGIPFGLYFYYSSQKNPNFINKFLNKKMGEAPVYASDVELFNMEEIILNRVENRGFFNSAVASEMIKEEEKKKATAIYTVNLREPYRLENYKLDAADSLQIYKDIAESMSSTLLHPGIRFKLSALKAERSRINEVLKSEGYYNFQPNLLIFEADTNQYKEKKFDLFLRLKKNLPKKAIIPYELKNVNIYPNYVVGNDSISLDTLRLDHKNFIQEEVYFEPKKLLPYILLEEGERYNPKLSRYTGRRLSSIGSYKFVNIRYELHDSVATTDSIAYLDAHIYLSPMNRRAIRVELQAIAKSNNFAGPGLAVTYTNRNLFLGGEVLNITGRAAYAAQIAGGDPKVLNSIEFGLQTDLIVPRMLFPISINNDWFQYSIPKTKMSLGGDYLSRSQLYSLGSVTASFGYFWNANEFIAHELDPIVVNYVSLTNTTKEFEDLLDENPFLQKSFNQEFIAGLTYSFTYNEMGHNLKHQFFVNANLDIAGNLISLVSTQEEDGSHSLFGLNYAQYAKTDVDLRYHFNINEEQTIAARLFGGIGFPYGNSEIMPYSKKYFSGGPYSVRAFRMRSLGPGTYSPEREGNTAAFFDQTGNLRLEANVEYRFPIYSFLKGAVFADAGNVWNTQDIEGLQGDQFSSDFLNEFGIGIGTGLRVDIQNFVIRVDLAFPMHNPALPEGERWTYDFGSPVLNFAIGYPF